MRQSGDAKRLLLFGVLGFALAASAPQACAQVPYFCDGDNYSIYNSIQFTRENGNMLSSYDETWTSGPAPNYWVNEQTSTYSLNETTIYILTDESAAGGSIERSFTSTLYISPNYFTGAYLLKSIFWGDNPTCIAEYGVTYNYRYYNGKGSYTAQDPTVTAVTGNAGTTAFTNLAWSTDSPALLSISAPAPSQGISNATLTSLGHSEFGSYNPDADVTMSIDGLPSAPLAVYINTPYTMLTTSAGSGTCDGVNLPDPGYYSSVLHSLADLDGATLVPITTTESLENEKYLGSWNSSNANWLLYPPTPSTWCPSGKGCRYSWYTSNFIDSFATCGPNAKPVPSSPGNGNNAVDNLTQKFWAGSPQGFSGACTEEGVVTYYTDHGVLSSVNTPVPSQSQCARGATIN